MIMAPAHRTSSSSSSTSRRRRSRSRNRPLLLLLSLALLLLLLPRALACASPSASACHETVHIDLPLVPPLAAAAEAGVMRLGIVHLSPNASSFSSSSAWTTLPPGLHLFFALPPSTSPSSAHAAPPPQQQQRASLLLLLSLLAPQAILPSSLPFLQQFSRLPAALRQTIERKILGWGEEEEEEGREGGELLWYHVAEAVEMEEDGLVPLLIPQNEAEEEGEDEGREGATKRSLLGYILSASFSSSSPSCLSSSFKATARVLTCLVSSTTSSSPSFPHSLTITTPGPPGLHREIHYSYKNISLPPPSSSSSPFSPSLLLVFHFPQGAYIDTYELSERHNFFPSSLPPSLPPFSRPLLLTAPGPIDVERPFSHSSQHCIALFFPPSSLPSSDPSLLSLSFSLPLHLRYPLPSLDTAHPYSSLPLPLPWLWLRHSDKDEWHPLPPARPPSLPPSFLRVPAGEAWRGGYVVWLTLLAEIVGALLLIRAVWGAREGGKEGKRSKGRRGKEGEKER